MLVRTDSLVDPLIQRLWLVWMANMANKPTILHDDYARYACGRADATTCRCPWKGNRRTGSYGYPVPSNENVTPRRQRGGI